ncbi:MAG: tetratricopeptide repeat protein [Leptolyngbya sp. SIO4C5]|nr:tetratricopeptide repeat protein [Leptolyngbya sp. SIO4C5]
MRLQIARFWLLALMVVTVAVPLVEIGAVPVMAQEASREERKAEADRLLQLGAQQHSTNQFQEAIRSWQEALEIYTEVDNINGEIASLRNLGIAHQSINQHQQAIIFYQRYLEASREFGN